MLWVGPVGLTRTSVQRSYSSLSGRMVSDPKVSEGRRPASIGLLFLFFSLSVSFLFSFLLFFLFFLFTSSETFLERLRSVMPIRGFHPKIPEANVRRSVGREKRPKKGRKVQVAKPA